MPRRGRRNPNPNPPHDIGGRPYHLGADRLQPGHARQERIHRPHRDHLIRTGLFTPSNRWRRSQSAAPNILERPLALARLLPFLPKYNFARS